MLTHINDLLNDWALWRKGARGRSAGGISPFPAYNLVGRGGSGHGDNGPPLLSYVPIDELRCAEVDRCVCALQPLLRQAVEEFYTRIGTTEQAARRCQCSRMTLHRRIDQAHNLILGYLNDIASGIEVKAWTQTEQVLVIEHVPISNLIVLTA